MLGLVGLPPGMTAECFLHSEARHLPSPAQFYQCAVLWACPSLPSQLSAAPSPPTSSMLPALPPFLGVSSAVLYRSQSTFIHTRSFDP